MRRGINLAMMILITAAMLASAPPACGEEERRISPGLWELGAAGSFDHVEGNSQIDLGVRLGHYLFSPELPLNLEAELGYTHIRELDFFELGALVSLVHAGGDGGFQPHLGLGASVRQEWLGSFSQARVPVGLDLGTRFFLSDRALLRLDYRYRRVLRDPVANFNEHRLRVGFSLLLGERP